MEEDATLARIEREIDRLKVEMLRIDESGGFVHRDSEKLALAEQLASLEAQVEEWR
jgi:hypothetical protein